MKNSESQEDILKALPQTQCGACGFPGCAPYANAITHKKAPINLCPPGGLETLETLAVLTHQNPEPLKSALLARITPPQKVVIRESDCIGCTKCLPVCPVDAIYGAPKKMHVVLTELCTGCGLCIDPCPMNCIETIAVEVLDYNREQAREAYEAKIKRGAFRRIDVSMPTETEPAVSITQLSSTEKKQFILEAVTRAKNRKRV